MASLPGRPVRNVEDQLVTQLASISHPPNKNTIKKLNKMVVVRLLPFWLSVSFQVTNQSFLLQSTHFHEVNYHDSSYV